MPLAPSLWKPIFARTTQQRGNVGFCFGPQANHISVRPHDAEGGISHTSVEFSGGTLACGLDAELSPVVFRHFRDAVRSVADRGSGVARLSTGGEAPLRIELRGEGPGVFSAVCDHRDSIGRSFHADFSPTTTEVSDLMRQLNAVCAELASWSTDL